MFKPRSKASKEAPPASRDRNKKTIPAWPEREV
jgi:hypothetical protein